MNETRQSMLYRGAVVSLVALIALCVAWELAIAPLRPGGSWMVLKVLPLLIPLRGVLKRNLYTMQWSSMMILLYFAEGIVRGVSDPSALSRLMGWVEVSLSTAFFLCVVMFLAPYKRAAKALARQAIDRASQ